MFAHLVSATSLLKSLNLSVFSVTSVAELQFLGSSHIVAQYTIPNHDGVIANPCIRRNRRRLGGNLESALVRAQLLLRPWVGAERPDQTGRTIFQFAADRSDPASQPGPRDSMESQKRMEFKR
jgi:hypothetical protein